MKKLKRLLIVLCVVLIFSAICLFMYRQAGRGEEFARRVNCLAQVHAIGKAIEKFRESHGSIYPRTLFELYPEYIDSKRTFICPGDLSDERSNQFYSSYVYLYPDKSTNSNDILVREKYGNHCHWGRDLNGYWILRVNGSSEWVSLPTTGLYLGNRHISGSQSFLLSSAQVKEMRGLADKGDSEAAFKLYLHYSFGMNDQKNGLYWLKKAADLGNTTAKQHLDTLNESK